MEKSAPGGAPTKSSAVSPAVSPAVSHGRLIVEARTEVVKGGDGR
jgi:hypothetical protein